MVRLYAVYHEHFEVSNFDNQVRVTCTCGRDFIWTAVSDRPDIHHCPNCMGSWRIALVEDRVIVTRERTKAKVVLRLVNLSSSDQDARPETSEG